MKIKTLVRAPALTSSGYGVHSRQVISALLNDPNFDVFLEAVPWGSCPFLTEKTQETNLLRQLSERFVVATQQGLKDYDLFISVTIPQEFERRGKVNIGITAAAETDRCSAQWLQKCNEMDFVLTPSRHALENLARTCLNFINHQTNQQGTLKLEKPIAVLPEGLNRSVFHKRDSLKTRLKDIKFKANFNFLVVGQWGGGTFGEDRKNIANTIVYFLKAFRGRKDVGLVLKVNMARYGEADKGIVQNRIQQILNNIPENERPPIHLLHHKLTDEEMGDLYNHPQISCLVSFTHGEGFGLPLLEAAACSLPIIATNWSGHLDFLAPESVSEKLFTPVAYDMVEVPQAAVWEPVIVQGSQWAAVREEDAIHALKKMASKYDVPRERAEKLSKIVNEKFDLVSVQKAYLHAFQTIYEQMTGQGADSSESLKALVSEENAFAVLYTMPMSTGDVFISTAVIDGLMKSLRKEHPDAKLFFATNSQYQDVLKDNPNVHKVIPWNDSMMNVSQMEEVFDLVLTPNVATQYLFSNWVRGGHGRLLAEEYANHCQSELGEYFIAEDDSIFTDALLSANGDIDLRHQEYFTFAPGSGKNESAARKYTSWQEVITNLKATYPAIKIVQVGTDQDSAFDDVDVDLRGKTTHQQLASVIKNSKLHLSIDTFSMHLAASYNVPLVSLFGSSHAGSTGPYYKNQKTAAYVLLEASQKMGCHRACYKNACKVNPELPCINEISSQEVVSSCVSLLDKCKISTKKNDKHEHKHIFGKISGYTTSYNAISMGYPFVESISSMLGFCDEVVVVDHSTDGTFDVLQKMADDDSRIQLYQRDWDLDNPSMDGDAKAFARALTQYEFCWQQDLDECVHEKDYEKIKWITKAFPSQADILHLPVIEYFGDEKHATGRRHSWKWRLSRNNPSITHGINKFARVTDPETGLVYAKDGMSDGCEYVDQVSFEPLPHTGFYSEQLEHARLNNPELFEAWMNQIIEKIPSVHHFSWFSIPGKIKQFQTNWTRQWNVLYQKKLPPRFPKDCDIAKVSEKIYSEGGEESDQVKYKYKLKHSIPSIMRDWVDDNSHVLKKVG